MILKYKSCLKCLKQIKHLSTAPISHKQKDLEHYDVIIAGGGLVGFSASLALAKHQTLSNMRVLLLEGSPIFKGASRENYSNRVSAINKQSVNLLKSLDVWDYILSVRCQPVMQMQVWDALANSQISFNHENCTDSIAYIVENDLIMEALNVKLLQNHRNVHIQNDSQIKSCKLIKDGSNTTEVSLKNGNSYRCDLLIGADGANSIVRKQMNVDNISISYKQMGIVATLELEDVKDTAKNTVAWQRFLPSGPIALLPLNSKMSSLVWTTNVEHAKELLKMEPTTFVNSLNEALIKVYPKGQFVDNVMKLIGTKSNSDGQLPPKIKSVHKNSRAAFPLGMGHAASYISEGVALIGDAAHRVHPLAGQGVNLGFGDVVCLTELLGDVVYNGGSIGDINSLLKYERTQLQKNVPIILGVHGLQRLYCSNFGPLVVARGIGLNLTNSLPPLKKFFMDRALA